MSFFVKCINASGYNSGLIEDAVYKVLEVTEKGNFILEGATPPEPFTSFEKIRFAVPPWLKPFGSKVTVLPSPPYD